MISVLQKFASDTRSILMMVAGVIFFYIGVLIPMDRKVQSMNRPLESAWERLRTSVSTHRMAGVTGLRGIDQLASGMESTLLNFTNAEAELISRILLADVDQEHVKQPFQLVEYENAIVALKEQISRECQAQEVTLGETVHQGFPRHDVSLASPSLLWADLAFTRDLLTLSIATGVGSIKEFETLTSAAVSQQSTNEHQRLHRSRFSLRLMGDMDAVNRFLNALPLRGMEAKEQGLPCVRPERPALYAERILLQKGMPQAMNLVDLKLVINGFIYHQGMWGNTHE